jgi:hypothetical protein
VNDDVASTHGNSGSSFLLAANGTLLILAGLLLGPAIAAAQESLVLVCQVVPSLFMLLAWAILVWGVFQARAASGE